MESKVCESLHLTEEALCEHIVKSVTDVFSSMVQLEVNGEYPLSSPVTEFLVSCSAMVGFAGTYSGIVSFHCPQQYAMKVAGNMIGCEIEEMCDDVSDAIGEIANMVAGNIKQVLSRGGLDLHLSIPTIIFGDKYVLETLLGNESVVVPFSCEEDRFLVGLSLKKND